MRKECLVQKSKFQFNDPMEKARFVLSSAVYDSDSLSKEEIVALIVRGLDYIQEWRAKNND